MSDQVSQPYKTKGKSIFQCISLITFVLRKALCRTRRFIHSRVDLVDVMSSVEKQLKVSVHLQACVRVLTEKKNQQRM
jgi:hypothetical protein